MHSVILYELQVLQKILLSLSLWFYILKEYRGLKLSFSISWHESKKKVLFGLHPKDVQWHQQRRMQWQQLLGHQKCLHQKQQQQHEQTVLMVLLSFSAMEKNKLFFWLHEAPLGHFCIQQLPLENRHVPTVITKWITTVTSSSKFLEGIAPH